MRKLLFKMLIFFPLQLSPSTSQLTDATAPKGRNIHRRPPCYCFRDHFLHRSEIMGWLLMQGSSLCDLHVLLLSPLLDSDADFILSQDFFCTPDYITPDVPPLPVTVGFNKLEELPCPNSPEKIKSVRSKRQREAALLELEDDLPVDTEETENQAATESHINKQGYVSQFAVALRCRVMPPPCMKNP